MTIDGRTPDSIAADPIATAEVAAAAPSLERRIASGTAWSFLGILTERIAAFVVFALVVRNLVPADVGIVTLAVVFVDLTLILTQGGLPEAIVRHESPRPVTFETAFWTNIGLGALMTGALAVAAQPIATLYATPQLADVLYALSPAFLLTACGAVHGARLSRALRFKALAARSMSATLLGGATALWLSYTGHGLWALVAQRLVTATVATLMIWGAERWLPRLRFDFDDFRQLMRLGVRLTASAIVLQLTSTVSLLIIGAMMSNAAVGYYRVANRLLEMATQLAINPVTQVALAGFASVQTDPARLGALHGRMTSAVSAVSIAAFFGLGALADPAITLVFGPEWAPSVPLLAIMCAVALPLTVNIFVWPLMTSRGHGGRVLRFGLLQLSVSVVLSAAAAPFGAVAVAAAFVVRGFIVMPYALRLTGRELGIGPGALLARLAGPTAAALIMAAALVALQRWGIPDASPIEKMLIGVPTGIVVYAAIMALFARKTVRELRETAALSFGRTVA